MATWTVEWPGGPQTLLLPDDNLTVLEDPGRPPQGTPVELAERALANLIGCPPLEEMVRPGDHVALLITDHKDRLFGHEGLGEYILDRLNRAGIADRDLTVVHAAGMHGHPGGRDKVGRAILDRVNYVEHDPIDDGQNRFLGATLRGTPVWVNRYVCDADFVMGIGACGPSLYGFQGGAGIILPGVAGRDTIRYNHARILSPRTISAWGPGNPQREDVMDAGDLARLRLKIDFAADTAFAGYFREEWPVAVDYVRHHAMVATDPADLYVFKPSNQKQLTGLYVHIESAERVTHEDGVVIAVLGATEHEPLVDRPVSETLDELIYCTEQWCRATEANDPTYAHWNYRDEVCRIELMTRPLDELTRIITRMQGEPRSTTMSWSHRRSIERRHTILVTHGVSRAEGLRMGFRDVTSSFADAVSLAHRVLGPRPRTVANMGPRIAIPVLRSELAEPFKPSLAAIAG